MYSGTYPLSWPERLCEGIGPTLGHCTPELCLHACGYLIERVWQVSCGTEVRSLAVGLGGGSLEFVLPEGGARQDQHQYKKYLELNGLDFGTLRNAQQTLRSRVRIRDPGVSRINVV